MREIRNLILGLTARADCQTSRRGSALILPFESAQAGLASSWPAKLQCGAEPVGAMRYAAIESTVRSTEHTRTRAYSDGAAALGSIERGGSPRYLSVSLSIYVSTYSPIMYLSVSLSIYLSI